MKVKSDQSTSTRSVTCDVCGELFRSLSNLGKHKTKTHSDSWGILDMLEGGCSSSQADYWYEKCVSQKNKKIGNWYQQRGVVKRTKIPASFSVKNQTILTNLQILQEFSAVIQNNQANAHPPNDVTQENEVIKDEEVDNKIRLDFSFLEENQVNFSNKSDETEGNSSVIKESGEDATEADIEKLFQEIDQIVSTSSPLHSLSRQ